MAQKQLDVTALEEFTSVQWEPNQVTCQLDDRVSLVVKHYQKEVYVLLRNGTRAMKLSPSMFDAICRAQVSIAHLVSYVKEPAEKPQTTEQHWLCSYCGLRFVRETDCQRHESEDHAQSPSDWCFHANLMECLDCAYCCPASNDSV